MSKDPKELAGLEPDWNSYGAVRITPDAIEAATAFKDAIEFVPLSDGGIQVEVHAAGIDAQAEIGPDGLWQVMYVGRPGA